MVLLYHERQVAALCGCHCLNNLLQGPYFSEVELGEIAQDLDRHEQRLMLEAGADTPEARAFMREESSNVGLDGNFSIQVLSSALERSHGVTLEDTRSPENRNAMARPETQEGYVLNRSSHWYCMRKIEGTWWECNSTRPAPERLGDRGLGSVLAELAADSWTVFLVKGKLPAPMSRSSGMGDPSNWVDPANPPVEDGMGGFRNAAQKQEPSFQAFSGSGNRLGGGGGGSGGDSGSGGGSSGGGAAAAAVSGASEDEQLAMALSLSAGLAIKARLEARLPPEPETGAGAARILVRMPDGSRASRRFAAAASISSLLDYVCVQLAGSGATSPTNNWQLVSQHPPLKIAFAPDATAADASALSQTFTSAGLAPSAQLHVAPLL